MLIPQTVAPLNSTGQIYRVHPDSYDHGRLSPAHPSDPSPVREGGYIGGAWGKHSISFFTDT